MIGADEQSGSGGASAAFHKPRIDPVRALRRLQDYRGDPSLLDLRKIDLCLPVAEVDHDIGGQRRDVSLGTQM